MSVPRKVDKLRKHIRAELDASDVKPVSLPNLPLPNIRWERFAQALANGESQTKAYVSAGYRPNNGQSSRLANEPSVARRVAYILQTAADTNAEVLQKTIEVASKEAGITKAMVLNELWDNAKKAKAANNYSASNQALSWVGREIAMFRGFTPKLEEAEEPAGRTGLDEEAVGKIKQKILDITS